MRNRCVSVCMCGCACVCVHHQCAEILQSVAPVWSFSWGNKHTHTWGWGTFEFNLQNITISKTKKRWFLVKNRKKKKEIMVRKEMMNLESFCGRTNIQHNSSSADHTRKSVWTQKTGEYLKCSWFYLTQCTPTVQTRTYTHPCLHSNVHFRSLHWKSFSKQLSDKQMPNRHRVTEVCCMLEWNSQRDSEAWELVVGSPSVCST